MRRIDPSTYRWIDVALLFAQIFRYRRRRHAARKHRSRLRPVAALSPRAACARPPGPSERDAPPSLGRRPLRAREVASGVNVRPALDARASSAWMRVGARSTTAKLHCEAPLSNSRRSRSRSGGANASVSEARRSSIARAMNASDGRVRVAELLSACADAALRGCEEIRRVQRKRDEAASDDETAFVVTRKDAMDPRSALTEADVAAQAAIVSALGAAFPMVAIVGEEDENEEAAPSSPNIGDSLRLNLCHDVLASSGAIGEALRAMEVACDDITLFVDPVDGTREFVEERLHAVQCLIGVAVRGRAVGGIIGLPFPDGDVATSDACVIWGLAAPGAPSGAWGILGERGRAQAIPYDEPRVENARRSVTGDSNNAALKEARAILSRMIKEEGRVHAHGFIGGAGNKILAVAENRSDYALMHFGTSLWDTCAPEGVLRAIGGKMTDLFGAPLTHSRQAPTGLVNRLGVVATGPGMDGPTHDDLCAEMRKSVTLRTLLDRCTGGDSTIAMPTDRDDTAQASDVARCLDGSPLRAAQVAQSVAQKLGIELNEEVKLLGYASPEIDAVRGLMSDACRLTFKWSEAGEKLGLPKSAFYKKVDMGNLAYMRTKAITQPLKIGRDSRSYRIEASFLASAACAALKEAGIEAPRCYAADLRPHDTDPIESKFSLLLEDFRREDGWHQEKMLRADQAKFALRALARFHAFFLPGSRFRKLSADNDAELRASVWPSGGYWQPNFQPPEQMEVLEDAWKTHMVSFGDAFRADPYMTSIEVSSVGARLQKHAKRIGAEAHPFSGCPGADDVLNEGGARLAALQTVIHGDPKQGNIFVKKRNDDWEIGLIDFQWTGFGLPGTDLGHFMCASVHHDAQGVDGSGPEETALVDAYYDSFCAAAVEFGAASSVERVEQELLSREELQTQYENGVLDTCRCVFGYQWLRVKANPETLAANAMSIGRNSYNKSLPNALWMVRAASNFIDRREARVA